MPPRAYAYRKLWLGLGWVMVTTVAYLSLVPSPPSFPTHSGDKLVHLLTYAALMFWFSSLYSGRRRAVVAVGFMLMGLLLEFLQGLAGHRSAEAMDIMANAAGVAAGWLLAITRLGDFLTDLDHWLAHRRV